jgi:hypothetical protein
MTPFETSCMPSLKEWAQCMERAVVCPYIKIFIVNWYLHDPKKPSLRYQCGGYWLDMGDNDFKCH